MKISISNTIPIAHVSGIITYVAPIIKIIINGRIVKI